MIPLIISYLVSLAWLLMETDMLRIRLPYGTLESPTVACEPLASSKASAAPIQPLLITEQCYLSKVHEVMSKQARDHTHDWRPGGYDTHNKPSYQGMVIGGSTITLIATLPDLHKRIADLRKAANSRPLSSHLTYAQLPMFVEQVKTGSHQKPIKWVALDGKEYKSTETVFDYKPVFHDCLVPKTWLRKHYKDVIPEPTMELTFDGKTLSVNSNYKSGLVKDFIKAAKLTPCYQQALAQNK